VRSTWSLVAGPLLLLQPRDEQLSAGTYSIAIDLHDGVSRTAQISLQAFTFGNCESDDGGD
jgi:hypothetical protein